MIFLAVIVAILLVYALWGRDWLKSKPWAQPFFDWIEPVEIFLFKKSETVLVARTLQGLGAILTALTWLGSIDITPILPFVPEKYAPYVQGAFSCLPLVLNALGAIVERLRNNTTKPIELVAVKEADATAEVKVAIAAADEAKEHAVAIVKAS